jgi:hypothetical protein
MEAFTQWEKTHVNMQLQLRLKFLFYQLIDFLNVSAIFQETSSLFVGKNYPFLFLFLWDPYFSACYLV